MKISVTRKDIEKGIKENSKQCAIALAVRRASRSKNVSVGIIAIYINKKHYSLPDEAYDFMCAFDKGKLVKPLTFETKRKVK